MAHVADKADLLHQAAAELARLLEQVADIPEQVQIAQPVCAEWTVKDLLAHLHAWHLLYFDWQRRSRAGEPVALPAPGYRWNETPQLNAELWRRYRNLPLAEAHALLRESHARLLAEIAQLPDDDVMRPGAFAWTGKNALETYLVSLTAAHYRWARREIRKGLLSAARSGRPGEVSRSDAAARG